MHSPDKGGTAAVRLEPEGAFDAFLHARPQRASNRPHIELSHYLFDDRQIGAVIPALYQTPNHRADNPNYMFAEEDRTHSKFPALRFRRHDLFQYFVVH